MSEVIRVDYSNLSQKIQSAMDEIGTIIESEAYRRCPVEFGTMGQSIDSKLSNVGEDIVVRIGTNNIEYADLVEYGTFKFVTKYGASHRLINEVENPLTEWGALIKRGAVGSGQTIPFLRSAEFITRNECIRVFKEKFK